MYHNYKEECALAEMISEIIKMKMYRDTRTDEIIMTQ